MLVLCLVKILQRLIFIVGHHLFLDFLFVHAHCRLLGTLAEVCFLKEFPEQLLLAADAGVGFAELDQKSLVSVLNHVLCTMIVKVFGNLRPSSAFVDNELNNNSILFLVPLSAI